MRWFLLTLLMCVVGYAGNVTVYCSKATMTTRPFTATEIRTVFSKYGKEIASVDAPGQVPEDWKTASKPRVHGASMLQWNASFPVDGEAKYHFSLTSPNVCSALFVDGVAVASWMESYGSFTLASGVHIIQLLAIQRHGENLPAVVVQKAGYPVQLQYLPFEEKKYQKPVFFIQTGNSLALNKGAVSAVSGMIVPAVRVDTRVHIAEMPPVFKQSCELPVKLVLDFPKAADDLLAKIKVRVAYVNFKGKELGLQEIDVTGHTADVLLKPIPGVECAKFSFTVADKEIAPAFSLHFIDAGNKKAVRASGNAVYIGDERAVLVYSGDKKQLAQMQKADVLDKKTVILDAIGNEEYLAVVQKKYANSEVRQVLLQPGTVEGLAIIGKLDFEAQRVVLLGQISLEMMQFIYEYCAMRNMEVVLVSLPGDREQALHVKEMGYKLGIAVIDLRFAFL